MLIHHPIPKASADNSIENMNMLVPAGKQIFAFASHACNIFIILGIMWEIEDWLVTPPMTPQKCKERQRGMYGAATWNVSCYNHE